MMKGGGRDTASNLRQLVLCEAAQMVKQSVSQDQRPMEDIGWELCHLLESGVVLRKFRDMVEAQGGDTSVVDNPESYPTAPFQCNILAPKDGFVFDMNALVIGQASVLLGAGRRVAADGVDALAGLWLYKVVGEHVNKGNTVVTLHTSLGEDVLQKVKVQVEGAIVYSDEPPVIHASISHIVTKDGMTEFEMPVMLR